MTIWREFTPLPSLFDYIVFSRNHFNGNIMGIDWVAVDVLLKREKVTVQSNDFSNFRVVMTGYVEALNEHINNTSTT